MWEADTQSYVYEKGVVLEAIFLVCIFKVLVIISLDMIMNDGVTGLLDTGTISIVKIHLVETGYRIKGEYDRWVHSSRR